MNKIAILALLVGVFAAIVSVHGSHHHHFDDDFGHNHHHIRPHWHKGGLGHHGFGGGIGGIGGGLGGGLGGLGKGGFHKGRHGGHFGKGLRRHRRPFLGGGISGSNHGHAGLHDDSHLHGSNFVGGHGSSLVGGNKRFDLDHHDNDFQDNSGIRKHQVINRDKVFAKDSTRGVNDVDGFRNVNGHSDSSHLGASAGGFAGHEAGGAAGSRFDLDRDFGAHAGHESDLEAGGFAGSI